VSRTRPLCIKNLMLIAFYFIDLLSLARHCSERLSLSSSSAFLRLRANKFSTVASNQPEQCIMQESKSKKPCKLRPKSRRAPQSFGPSESINFMIGKLFHQSGGASNETVFVWLARSLASRYNSSRGLKCVLFGGEMALDDKFMCTC
jgi:hypothetical protein